MKKLKELINEDYQLSKYKEILILLLVFVISGIFGFIYETIFYRIDLGFFVKRGSTFGPWIPIYGFGGVLIALICQKFKNKPIIVLLLGTTVCGILEFLTGYLLYTIAGIRLWNYYTEIWNFGNIGGYICLRSVAFFGIAGLLLIYFILPIIRYYGYKLKAKFFSVICLSSSLLFITDIVLYLLIK